MAGGLQTVVARIHRIARLPKARGMNDRQLLQQFAEGEEAAFSVLVDRYGVKRVVLFSMAASSLGSAAFALAPNLMDVFAARLIIACGDALVFTALLLPTSDMAGRRA